MGLESKQRVVGAIVLVAFIALLIPFLFTDGIKKKQQVTSSEVEVPPAPISNIATNQEIDKVSTSLEQNPSLAKVAASDTVPSIGKSATEIQKNPVSSKEPSQSTEQAESLSEGNQVLPPESENDSVSANMPAAQVTEGDVGESVAKPMVSKTKKGIVVSKKKTAAKKMSAKIFWSVQVGSFSDPTRTQSMVTSLQKKGYSVYLQKINTTHGPMVRVLVGHETSKAGAIKIANRLKTQLKINGQIVRNKK